ncbi:hypothetical protein Ddye_017036 [Dipteronia dyeriana]|uniref:Uncharacterized protein n=1 Tax=Dipteronia dyeriana TaxID=168575 RepID=A0AAD9X0T7_9ROSI|nr:hypothetical protein Ddye_017036 [Dipteronia dyeriana]
MQLITSPWSPTLQYYSTAMALSRLFLTTSLLLFSLLVLASASDYSYGSVPKPDTKESKPQDNYNNDSKPQQPKEDRYSTPDNYKPRPGKPGFAEKKKLVFPTSHRVTDGLKVIKECKAFLEDSPMEDCKVPTDVNRGISGALLNSYRILDNMDIKLFKVGPFFYTSESQYSDPNNGTKSLNLP